METKLVSFHQSYFSRESTYISLAEYKKGKWTGRSWEGEISNKKLAEILKPFLKAKKERIRRR